MSADRPFIRSTLTILPILVMLTLAVACSAQEDPFPVGDRATPTSTPTDAEQAQAAAAATPTFTPVSLPTSVAVSLPTSVPGPTEVPLTPESTATPLPDGQSTGSTSAPPSPTPGPQPAATPAPEPVARPLSQIQPTHTPVPIPADYDREASGPPRDELIKFAQWDDNRVKLSNWVAGYIVAHGLDYPVRIVDTESGRATKTPSQTPT